MMQAFISGFLLSFGLIMAIGSQNAFVLRQGIRGQHVLPLVLTCAISDALLITAGVVGFAQIIAMVPWLDQAMRYSGALFLLIYGAISMRSAFRGQAEGLNPVDQADSPLWPTILTCLALTWLNPHVYLDTVVLLGTVSSQYDPMAWSFGMGAASASFVFFFSLGYGAQILRPVFAKPTSWRVLDGLVALIMWSIAAGLLFGR
ncbi:LysE/ArgO family amino acid transporter [Cohaesibacter gelatinilyticus]|nr:LysE/ArgO family amino acid transporter [Cohaesibacter gelatinilyticus]